MVDPYIVLLILFISFSFFCSGSESALFSLTELKIENMKKKHPARAKQVVYLLAHSQKLLVAILIYNTFATIFVTLTANKIFKHYFPGIDSWLTILVTTMLLLIFGEVTPKTLAINVTTFISLTVAPFWYVSLYILRPFIFVFDHISKFLVSLDSFLFFRNVKEEHDYKTDEVIEVIKESRKHGIIDKEEEVILGNVIEFADTGIWELMRPRKDIFTLSIDTSIKEAIELVKEKKYSRIPVWENSEENIIGILQVKELLKLGTHKKTISSFRNILRKPFFIPETIKAEKLLRDFQTTKNHLAVVIDEYGGIAGLITLEDVLEAIIGEVVDKDDIKPLFYKYNTSMIEIEAQIEISEFNNVFRTNLKSETSSTVGGYLIEKIERIPITGETIKIDNLQFKITSALPNKIEKMVITKSKKNKADDYKKGKRRKWF